MNNEIVDRHHEVGIINGEDPDKDIPLPRLQGIKIIIYLHKWYYQEELTSVYTITI